MTQEFDVVFSEINESFDCTFESGDETFVMEMGSEFRPDQYEGYTEITPSEQTQVLYTSEKYVKNNIVVKPVPGGYILPEGTKEIDENGTYDIKRYAEVDVDVPIPPGYIIPSGTLEITENDDYDITEYAGVSVDVPIPPGYIVPSGTKQITSIGTGIDVTEYADVDVAIPDAVIGQAELSVSPQTPTINSSTGLVTANVGTTTGEIKPITTAGYVTPTTAIPYKRTGGSKTLQLDTQAGATITPTTSQQTAVAAGKYTLGDVKVGAIPSQYIVPSGTKQITANGTNIDVKQYEYADVAVPASTPTLQTKSKTYTPTTSQQTETVQADSGYDGLEKVNVTVSAVATGTAGTPTASKGTVSNHAIAVTPSVTNTTGYITGGTKTGTAVSVSASEVVSGTYTVSSSGTKDVTNYASASIQAGTAGTPALTVSAVENHSKTIRSSVINSTGWITGGTVSGASTTVSASDLVSGTLSITSNGTGIDVTNYEKVDVAVPGGGTSKNVQIAQSTTRATSSTYVKVCGDITVSKAGTYDIYWTYFRSSTSGTWGSQLYKNGVAQGSAQSTFTNHVCNVHLSNVSLAANDTVSVYARSRGSNYYGYVGQLTIIEA